MGCLLPAFSLICVIFAGEKTVVAAFDFLGSLPDNTMCGMRKAVKVNFNCDSKSSLTVITALMFDYNRWTK